MAKITLDVDSKNIDTVLIILNNLKNGLINNISSDKKNISTSLQSKKHINQQIVEDKLIQKAPTGGKYLSTSAYKQKLRNKTKG